MWQARTGTTGFNIILSAIIKVSICGLAPGTLLGERVLALILRMMAGGLLKMVSNCSILRPCLFSKSLWADFSP